MYKCNECDKSYVSVYGLNSHSRVHKPGYVNAGYVAGAGAFQREEVSKRKLEYDKAPDTCKRCDSRLTYEQHKEGNEFCNRSCAAKYNNNIRSETNPRPPLSTKQRSKSIRIAQCAQCSKEFAHISKKKFCSCTCKSAHRQLHPRVITAEMRERFRAGGLKSAASQSGTRRSANEIRFAELCTQHFLTVTTNDPIFNGWDADVVIHDIKVAVLWNGLWHYKKITKAHSVEQVQNRDRIKTEEIKRAGYTPYIIRDMSRKGKAANELFVQEQFAAFIVWLQSPEPPRSSRL